MATRRTKAANPAKKTPAQLAYFAKTLAVRNKYRKELGLPLAGSSRAARATYKKGGGPKKRAAAKRKPAGRNTGPHRAKRNVASIVRVEVPKAYGNAGAVVLAQAPRAARPNAPKKRNAPRGGGFGQLTEGAQVVASMAMTKLIVDGVLPPTLRIGWPGYLSTAIVAWGQGWAAGMALKNKRLGQRMIVGGMGYLTLRIMQDLLPPSLGQFFTLNGLGEIVPSSFPMPSVTHPGNMSRTFTPRDTRAYVDRAVAAAAYSGGERMRTMHTDGVGPNGENGAPVTEAETAAPMSANGGGGNMLAGVGYTGGRGYVGRAPYGVYAA